MWKRPACAGSSSFAFLSKAICGAAGASTTFPRLCATDALYLFARKRRAGSLSLNHALASIDSEDIITPCHEFRNLASPTTSWGARPLLGRAGQRRSMIREHSQHLSQLSTGSYDTHEVRYGHLSGCLATEYRDNHLGVIRCGQFHYLTMEACERAGSKQGRLTC